MKRATPQRGASGEPALLEPRLAYHLRCLREDATDPDRSHLERLTLVRDRARHIREIQAQLADGLLPATDVGDGD